LRLSNRAQSVEQISAYTGRSQASVCRHFDRWEQRSFEGFADGTAPGNNPPRITEEVRTEEVRALLKEKLSEEERTCNAPNWPRR